MTISNGYATLQQLKDHLRISDSNDDVVLERCIEAASRQIDRFTGRRFWQDSTVQTREFYADDARDCLTDDISTTTGLIVKLDDGDTGGFATTVTITTHFIVTPPNAADDGWPYTGIRLVDTSYSFPQSSSGRPGVQVTAKFGWATTPTDITNACLIQATQLYKAPDAAFGILAFGDGGGLRVRGGLNPIAAALVEPYGLPRVG